MDDPNTHDELLRRARDFLKAANRTIGQRPMPPESRALALRVYLRACIVDALQGELEGGEFFKEAWEQCENDEERAQIRGELRSILDSLLPVRKP